MDTEVGAKQRGSFKSVTQSAAGVGRQSMLMKSGSRSNPQPRWTRMLVRSLRPDTPSGFAPGARLVTGSTLKAGAEPDDRRHQEHTSARSAHSSMSSAEELDEPDLECPRPEVERRPAEVPGGVEPDRASEVENPRRSSDFWNDCAAALMAVSRNSGIINRPTCPR